MLVLVQTIRQKTKQCKYIIGDLGSAVELSMMRLDRQILQIWTTTTQSLLASSSASRLEDGLMPLTSLWMLHVDMDIQQM